MAKHFPTFCKRCLCAVTKYSSPVFLIVVKPAIQTAPVANSEKRKVLLESDASAERCALITYMQDYNIHLSLIASWHLANHLSAK